MKRENLFSINLHTDKVIDREEFILRRENSVIQADRKALNDKMSNAILKGAFKAHDLMPLFFGLCLLVGLCFGAVTLFTYFDTNTLSALTSGIAVVSLIASGVFWILGKVIKKDDKNPQLDAVNEEYGRFEEISKRDLRVPSDARTVELFGRFYHKESTSNDPYDIDQVTIFEEDGSLCLHYIGVVIAVPIDTIEAVVKVEETITFSDWMKDVTYDDYEYAEYNISKREIDEYDEEYSMNGYYSIRFCKDGIPFELLVPLYEIEPFLEILKIDVIEE